MKAGRQANAQAAKVVPMTRDGAQPLALDDLLRHAYALTEGARAHVARLGSVATGNAGDLHAWLSAGNTPSLFSRLLAKIGFAPRRAPEKVAPKVKQVLMKALGLEGARFTTTNTISWRIDEPIAGARNSALERYYPLTRLIREGAIVPTRLTFLKVPGLSPFENYVLTFHVGTPQKRGAILLRVRPRVGCTSMLLPALGVGDRDLLMTALGQLIPRRDSRAITRLQLKAMRRAAPARILEAIRVKMVTTTPTDPTEDIQDIAIKHGLDPVVAVRKFRLMAEQGLLDSDVPVTPRSQSQAEANGDIAPESTEPRRQHRPR